MERKVIVNKTNVRVRYAETDKMQFAHHSRYFEWFECARTELLREIGYSYKSVEDDGTLLPLVEAQCRYIAPAHYDDVLEINTRLANLPRATLRLDYEIIRISDGLLIARGYTVHAFVNNRGRPTKPPKKFIQKLQADL